METRANYLLVGSFVLLLVGGLVSFVLWFSKVQFDREFARYDIVFTGSVTSLDLGSQVRYSGVRVGEVIDIHVRVRRKGGKSMTYEFTFSRDGEQLAAGRMTSVCCVLDPSEDVRAIPIPPFIADKLDEPPPDRER